jgi:hypothetical protein
MGQIASVTRVGRIDFAETGPVAVPFVEMSETQTAR